LQCVGYHVAERGSASGSFSVELPSERFHERGPSHIFAASLRDCFSQMGLGLLRGFLGEARPDSFAPQLDQRLRSIEAANADQLLEQGLDGDWMALRCPWEACDHRRGDAVVLLEDDRVQELTACSEAFFRLHRNACRKRRRRAPPLGDGELRVEVPLHLLLEDWHG
jgi:hypothetical protein